MRRGLARSNTPRLAPPGVVLLGLAALGLLFVVHGRAAAEVPWTDQAPRLVAVPATEAEPERRVIVVAAVGHPVGRASSWAARRQEARHAARRRAVAMLHRYLDRALSRSSATPRQTHALHAAVDQSHEEVGLRPLSDAGAVVQIRIDVRHLHAAANVGGVPWAAP